MKNKKRLIVGISVVSIVVIILFGIIYFTTDLLKTEQQLFYKYIARVKINDSNFITQCNIANDRIAKNSNSSSANLDVSLAVQNQETGIADVQKILNVSSNALKNYPLNQSYRDFTFSSNEQEFLKLKYLKDGDTYGLFADNIVSKYLAIENSNLKDFFTKIGVEDVSQIPDTISIEDYKSLLDIDEATLEQLKVTYGTLIYNNINKENFYKISNEDKTEKIGVSLTENEIINILKIVLITAKNDTTLLNLIDTKAKSLNYTTTIEDMQTKIQSYIDALETMENEKQQQATTDINNYTLPKDYVFKIELIKKEKNVIGINFITNYTEQIKDYENSVDNELKTIDQLVSNKIEINFAEANKIIISVKENDVELYKYVTNYSYDANNISYYTEMEVKENEESRIMKLQYNINNYQTDNIVQNIVIDTNLNTNSNLQIKLVNNITLKQDVQISKLTTENSAKLNDMTSEELSQLFVALGNRINNLYGESLTNIYSNNILINAQNAQGRYEESQKQEEILQNYDNMIN